MGNDLHPDEVSCRSLPIKSPIVITAEVQLQPRDLMLMQQ